MLTTTQMELHTCDSQPRGTYHLITDNPAWQESQTSSSPRVKPREAGLS